MTAPAAGIATETVTETATETVTAPATGTGKRPALSDTKTVTADEITAYRDTVRSVIAVPGPHTGVAKASPVHAFVLAHGMLGRLVGELSADAPEPPAVVHLSQEIRVRRLPLPDEEVAIGLDLVAARREARGVRLALRCGLTGGDGAPIAELVTGVLLVGAASPEPFGEMPAYPAPPEGGDPAERIVVTHRLTTGMVRRYADVSGDHNPIHLDAGAARQAGFPGVIAHGMSVMALICEEVIDRYASGDAARVLGVAGRFSSPVSPEEPLDIILQPDREGRTIGFSCKTPQGVAVKSGRIDIAAQEGEIHD
ncbi:MaoC/PaaZ C-terminal domain-containing protein [Streptosporangium sp. NPDC051023]|uniref:MaoC/PaaZ C-terminal domain-containing protein n=1 Tax=Streptosporangium sp. NPDC051023 TaxID=3155410 RepID=UPI003450C2A3